MTRRFSSINGAALNIHLSSAGRAAKSLRASRDQIFSPVFASRQFTTR